MSRLFAFVALALPTGNAQLLVQPSADPAALAKQLGAEEAAEPSLTIQNPTICDSSVKQYAGYVPIEGTTNTKYFFWLFESRSNPSTDPLLMWLTGGPGCSSQLALLAENGPCTVNKDGTDTMKNDYSWNTKANVMWVDQPASTGFSTGPLLPTMHNETQVGNNMYKFLQAFFKMSETSKFAKSPFFVFGESYAGHYVPAVTHRIWQGNKAKEGLNINLQGLAIGNGLTDPQEQYKWYTEMVQDGGKKEGGSLAKGVINNTKVLAAMKLATAACVAAIKSCNGAGGDNACTTAYAVCNEGLVTPYQLTGMNPYDMRIPCEHGNLCYDFDNVGKYLNSASVKQQLGVTKKWGSCNYVVNAAFQGDWMHNFQTLIPDMLADDIRVMIYAGDVDFICNWLGNKHWTLAMEWPHKAEFNQAADKPYTIQNGNAAAGRLRSSNGFSFLQVYQAGHMVPMDKPEVALDMVDGFLSNTLLERTAEASVVV